MNTETQPALPSLREDIAGPIPPVADAAAKLRAIAERQGTLGRATFDTLFGAGSHLWGSDAEFERFQRLLRDARGRE